MSAQDQMRRGACPSLSRPMRTGDGLLVRLLPVTGMLSPAQLRGLAQAARRHGNGILEITARGNLQIRGLSEASVSGLNGAVTALGIEPRAGVPVESNPLAGLDGQEIADAAPVARAIRDAVAAHGLAARLGPKVSVVVDGGGRFGLGGLTADVRLDAERALPEAVWRVSIAGTAATARPFSRLPARDAVAKAVELLLAVAAKGLDARARDLLGAQHMERAWGAEAERPFVGVYGLADRSHALAVALAFGQSDAAAAEKLAAAAEDAGAVDMRFASDRRLVVRLPSERSCQTLRAIAGECGFITAEDDPRLAIVACAGAPACGSAFLDTKGLAARLAPLLRGEGFHVSGCPKRCAEPTGRLPALVGVAPGSAEISTASGASRVATRQALAAIRRLHASSLSDSGLPTQARRPRAPTPAIP